MTWSASPVAADVHALRLQAQRLAGQPAGSVEDVVEGLLSVQAQDARGARLAVRARSSGLSAAEVDAALTHRRSVVISWLNRGTLHLVRSADYWWLQRLMAPRLATGNRRRLEQEGVCAADRLRGVAVIGEALAREGPLTRTQIRERLVCAGVPSAGQAVVHLLVAATLEHALVRGPLVGREQAFALAETWLGPEPGRLTIDEALSRLARRYLVGHAPASTEDLARWAGISLSDARRGLAAIGRETTRVGDAGLVTLGAVAAEGPSLPEPKLLGAFDPVLLGWSSREFIIGSHAGIVTTNGVFRPFALVDGRAKAIWSFARSNVTLQPLEPLAPEVSAALHRDATRVRQFLGL